MNLTTDEEPKVVELDPAESSEFFDRAARRLLHISGDEFVAQYESGQFDDLLEGDDPRLVELEMLLPFWRAGHIATR